MPDCHADAFPPQPDPMAIYTDASPINPTFMREVVRTLMRALPMDRYEPPAWRKRRMHSALIALADMRPRDTIEAMIGVQAVCAWETAAVCWHRGMNAEEPSGNGLRHFAAANAAVRTFDTLLKTLERRQAKALSLPPGYPAARNWDHPGTNALLDELESRCRCDENGVDPHAPVEPDPANPMVWSQASLERTADLIEQACIDEENAGLDIANTEGILPGGGMIMPEDPTPQQAAYIARRLGLQIKREWAETQRRGGTEKPKIRPIRPGDLIP